MRSAGENKETQTDGEEHENGHARQPTTGQRFAPRTVLDRAAGFAAGQAFFHQLLPMKEFAHVVGGPAGRPAIGMIKRRFV